MTEAIWDKGTYLDYNYHITVQHHRKSRQKLKQVKNLDMGADLEAMESQCSLACFHGLLRLPYRTQITSPVITPPIMARAFFYQLLIKEMSSRLAYRQIIWTHFLN